SARVIDVAALRRDVALLKTRRDCLFAERLALHDLEREYAIADRQAEEDKASEQGENAPARNPIVKHQGVTSPAAGVAVLAAGVAAPAAGVTAPAGGEAAGAVTGVA